jgi:hypothetical protein
MSRKALLFAAIAAAALIGSANEMKAAAKLGQTCGGIAGIRCGTGEFCEFKTGSCGRFDQTGKCVKAPQICNMLFQPVCGCNGKTYSNNCVRERNKVSEKHAGKC